MPELIDSARQLGGLINLISSPEGSFSWAVGMRQEIQTCLAQPEFDRVYVGDCLKLLLRAGGWRRLHDAQGESFRSFIQFCYAPRPHGLGLTRAEVEAVLVD
jgi:hypothetical protein